MYRYDSVLAIRAIYISSFATQAVRPVIYHNAHHTIPHQKPVYLIKDRAICGNIMVAFEPQTLKIKTRKYFERWDDLKYKI